MWWWDSEIDAGVAKQQMDEFLKQGIRACIVYPATGLSPPFLSEGWWEIWGEILAHARQKNFTLGMVPDVTHPQGDARDVHLDPPDQSHVLLGHPEYRLQRLRFMEREVFAPASVRIENLPDPVIAIAAKRIGPDQLDSESLIDLSASIDGSHFESDFDAGHWLLTFYYPVNYDGPLNLRVDPLNRDATRRYIDLTLGELQRRFPEYVGSTFKYVLVDSEGTFGGPLVWTPEFFETFRLKKQYDLRKHLPLLVHQGGDSTPKIRSDYRQVVSEMFLENYWIPIASWCSARGLESVQQSWGDNIRMEVRYAGDFMAEQRVMTYPFAEDLFSWHSSPRQFKEAASIAHFERRLFWGECQLLQGVESFISPQKMRLGSNAIAAWGIVRQSVNMPYNTTHVSPLAPLWGMEQPHWKFFHHYVDLMRRIGYMNDESRHVADILLFKPLSTIVTASSTNYDGSGTFADTDKFKGARAPELHFSRKVDTDYGGLMELFVLRQRDFDVADDYYLEKATLEDGGLRIAEEVFGVLVLPPMTTVSRSSLRKIREFYESGGIVISYGTLPSGSIEQGYNDPQITADVRATFGVDPESAEDVEHHNERGGRSFFFRHGRERVVETIDRLRPADFKVQEGSANELFYAHRQKEGRDIYWIANNTEKARKLVVSVSVPGKPELWDPTTGKRRDTAYWVDNGRTFLPLHMTAWDGFYAVIEAAGQTAGPRISRTNLEDYTFEGGSPPKLKGRVSGTVREVFAEGQWQGQRFEVKKGNPEPLSEQMLSPHGWKFRPTAPQVRAHYGREMVVPAGHGVPAGFGEPGYNDRTWPLNWLSRQRFTIRQWWLIGPFPSTDRQGFNRKHPPESEVDLEKPYYGSDGRQLSWRQHHSLTEWVNLVKVGTMPGSETEAVGYAFTYVYSPAEQKVQALLEAANSKLWVNGHLVHALHGQYGYLWVRDTFSHKVSIPLKAGWNEILLKVVSSGPKFQSYFAFRLADRDELPVSGMLVSHRPEDPAQLRRRREARMARAASRFESLWPVSRLLEGRPESTLGKERWYRIQVPPGTRAFLMPTGSSEWNVHFNGRRMVPEEDGRVVFPQLDWKQSNVVALEMPAASQLLDYPIFESGTNEYQLGNWTWTGLTYYSGEAVYEKDFELSQELTSRSVQLDLGKVGVTAEVWLNDQKVGTRLWEPFRFDVTDYLRPGTNRLKIAVTNSDSNARAEASFERHQKWLDLLSNETINRTQLPYMEVIDLNGLVGPVQLVPEIEVELEIP